MPKRTKTLRKYTIATERKTALNVEMDDTTFLSKFVPIYPNSGAQKTKGNSG